MSEAVALRLRHHLFGANTGSTVKDLVSDANGAWELKSFRITDFEELEERPLADVVASLRHVKGSAWGDVPDRVRLLLEDRQGSGGAN